MAISRLLDQPSALAKGVVLLDGNITFGGSGAVSAVEGKGFTTSSIDHSGTGVYVLTMPGSGTVDVRSCHFQMEAASSVLLPTVTARDDSARTITVTLYGSLPTSPAATDPASGDKLHFSVVVNNTSAL